MKEFQVLTVVLEHFPRSPVERKEANGPTGPNQEEKLKPEFSSNLALKLITGE